MQTKFPQLAKAIDFSTYKRNLDEGGNLCEKVEQKRTRGIPYNGDYDGLSVDGNPISLHLPFRALAELQTEFFQSHGVAVWQAIAKGIEETNENMQHESFQTHKQSLRALVTQELLKRFTDEYFSSHQFIVNKAHCKMLAESWSSILKKYERASHQFWMSEFSADGRVGYDPDLLTHVNALYGQQKAAHERKLQFEEGTYYGLFKELKI